MTRVVVLGAGVVGLSTAINIQQRISGVHVTIVAEKFSQHTTSNGAGAIIVPTAPGIDDVTRRCLFSCRVTNERMKFELSLLRKWGRTSMDHFAGLAASETSSESGASLTMGIIYSPVTQPPDYGDLMLTCNPVPPSTAEKLHLGKYYCFTVTTVVVEMKKYLPWLMNRFKALGGLVIQRHVHSFSEFVGRYDLVVNCTGMGAKELTGDDKLIPVRGQTMRVSAPWVKHFLEHSHVTGEFQPMFYPNSDNLVLGAVKQPGNTDLTVNPETAEIIWDKITALWPPLKTAKLQYEWAGLRPHRVPPRVESELIRYGDKSLKVIHNYGHGATGVSLSWGTAVHATELAKALLAPSAKL